MDELSTSTTVADALATYLSAQAGETVSIPAFERISSGWESDVFAFDAPRWQPGGHILRLYFGANAGWTSQHEYHSMGLLARAGYPVPRVDLVEPSQQPLGRSFMIMQRVEGVSLGRRWHDADSKQLQRETERFCALQAKLHTLTWQHLAGVEHVPTVTISQQIEYWKEFGAKLSHDLVPSAAMSWLDDASRQVTPLPLGLVHWDFHHENILVDKDDRAWVIDWTQFQVTDIRYDLAWTIVLLASERDEGTAQAVREGYYAQRGWDAGAVEADMRFFEAAACAKRLLSVLISLNAGADTLGMRPGAEAIMSSRMSRIALVYKRWLALTSTTLPSVETMLHGHL